LDLQAKHAELEALMEEMKAALFRTQAEKEALIKDLNPNPNPNPNPNWKEALIKDLNPKPNPNPNPNWKEALIKDLKDAEISWDLLKKRYDEMVVQKDEYTIKINTAHVVARWCNREKVKSMHQWRWWIAYLKRFQVLPKIELTPFNPLI